MKEAFESIKNLGVKKIAILGAAGLSLMIGLIILATSASSGSMSPLYTNLSMEDANKITTELDSKSVKYTLAGNGTQILVPTEQALKLRMTFAAEGIPSSASIVGYEIFDKDEKLGTSSFMQNINQIRAMEGEIARTIMSMNKVKAARVHLVMPKKELFQKDKVNPTASIQVTMNGGDKLNPQEVQAIRYLVSTAVPGLSVDNVTIVDTRGILLARGGENQDDAGVAASNSQEYKMNIESQYRNRIEDMLEKYVGMGKVKAQVSADINFDRTTVSSETYDPEGQVARSVQTTNEKESAKDSKSADNASVASNLPNSQAGGTSGSSNVEQKDKVNEVTNYEISKTVKNQVSETGKVTKLSIAVMVEGTYEENKETGEFTYKDRSPEELKKLEGLVKSALGFDEKRGDKIEVTSLKFSEDFGGHQKESAMDWIKKDLQSVVQILVMGLVAAMVVLMVIRPLVKRAMEVNQMQGSYNDGAAPSMSLLSGQSMVPQIAGPSGGGQGQAQDQAGGNNNSNAGMMGQDDEDEGFSALAGIKGPQKSASLKKINEMIENNPEEALGVIRNWLYGETAA